MTVVVLGSGELTPATSTGLDRLVRSVRVTPDGPVAVLADRYVPVLVKGLPAAWQTEIRNLPDLLAEVARLARSTSAARHGLTLVRADLVVSPGLANEVTADDRHPTALLIAPKSGAFLDQPRPASGLVSVLAHRAQDAGSVAHGVHRANATSLGLLHIGPADTATLALAAERLAELSAQTGWRTVLSGEGDPTQATADASAGAGAGAGAGEAPSEDAGAGSVGLAGAAFDLLVVGLIRNGVDVWTVEPGQFVAEFAPDPADAASVARRADELDETKIRLARAARADDGFYSTFVVRRLSRPLSAIGVERGWQPNRVTVISLLLGLAGALCFVPGTRIAMIAGAILLQISLVVDCVDGEIARFTRKFSALGAWMDAVFDRLKEYAAYATLAAGAAVAGKQAWPLACLALGVLLTRHMMDFGFMARPAAVAAAAQPRPTRTLAADPSGSVTAAEQAGVADLSARTERGAMIWVKRTIAFPVGERFLVISLLAATTSACWVFLVLLAWGGVSLAYMTAGRVVRARPEPLATLGDLVAPGDRMAQGDLVAPVDQVAPVDLAAPGAPAALDDGRAQGVPSAPDDRRSPDDRRVQSDRSAQGDLRVSGDPGEALREQADLALLALLRIARADATPRPALTGRYEWLLPAGLRALEVLGVTILVALTDSGALWAAYLVLWATAYHCYDVVYRQRTIGSGPPPWLTMAALGVGGRLVLTAVMAILGLVEPWLAVLAGYVAMIVVTESLQAWRQWLSGAPRAVPEESPS